MTSYALFRLDTDAYSAGRWSGLVLDEAQFAKNHKSKVHKCATAVNAPFKLAITGTPHGEQSSGVVVAARDHCTRTVSQPHHLHRFLPHSHRKRR